MGGIAGIGAVSFLIFVFPPLLIAFSVSYNIYIGWKQKYGNENGGILDWLFGRISHRVNVTDFIHHNDFLVVFARVDYRRGYDNGNRHIKRLFLSQERIDYLLNHVRCQGTYQMIQKRQEENSQCYLEFSTEVVYIKGKNDSSIRVHPLMSPDRNHLMGFDFWSQGYDNYQSRRTFRESMNLITQVQN